MKPKSDTLIESVRGRAHVQEAFVLFLLSILLSGALLAVTEPQLNLLNFIAVVVGIFTVFIIFYQLYLKEGPALQDEF